MNIWKPLAWLVAGGVGGAIGVLWVLDDRNGAATSSGVDSLIASVAGLAFGGDTARASSGFSVAEHLDVYRDAQAETDPAELAAALERAAAERSSPRRDLEIDALIGRLAELAPDYAAQVATSLGLNDMATAEAYLAWAAADADAAIAGVTRIASPEARLAVALALTDVLGDNARDIARIGSALAPAEHDALTLEWIALRAARDPFDAFRDVQSLSRAALIRPAVETLASVWAAQDPQAALGQVDLLPAQFATTFRTTVFSEWARLDTEGFAAWLEAGTGLQSDATTGLEYLLAADPARVERLADNFSGVVGTSVRAQAVSAGALRDPAAAMARVSSLPPGQERDALVQAVVTALSSQDPAAALNWVRSLTPPSPGSNRAVAMALARADIDYAYQMIDDPAAFGVESALAYTIVSTLAVNDLESAPDLAGALLARGDPQSQAALRNLVGNWMNRDPQKALDWVLGHGTEIDGTVLANAAQTLSARDPAAAAGYVDRIPQQHRGAWIAAVAKQYGRSDLPDALTWVSGYQGQTVYEVAMREVISSAAQADPQAAAQTLLQMSPEIQLGAAQPVGTAWARQDPPAAARWATSIRDPDARMSATGAVANAWYDLDRDAARRWLLSQPVVPERDQMLSSLALNTLIGGNFDAELLDAFSSAEMREGIATMAVGMMADDDPARARALLEREVRNPEQRARLEALIGQNTRR
jgi:hypothetical protein